MLMILDKNIIKQFYFLKMKLKYIIKKIKDLLLMKINLVKIF